MDPDVAEAIPELVRRGILPEQSASHLLRVARRELISVYPELRLLFYLGVLLTSAGAGLLVKENYQHIGPVVIAVALGAIALAALLWVVSKAPRFSWDETSSPSLAFDYLLLLGVLLAAADLGFIEAQFTPLGDRWPWHLLLVSLFMATVAVRFDSRAVFSLSLSTFAAWRGLSVSLVETSLWHATADSVRWNAVGCGVVFVILGLCLVRGRRKPHFEPLAAHLGWLLILCALASGGAEPGFEGFAYIISLGLTGAGLSWQASRKRRLALFALGVLAVYVAASQLVLKGSLNSLEISIWFIVSSLALLFWLWKFQRKLKEPR